MAPANQSFSMWAEEDYDSSEILLDCLLPTGVLITMMVPKDHSISLIKRDLWMEARRYPLYNMIENKMESYVFLCVNEMAVKEELTDESRRLCDVRPFQPCLKLVETTKQTGQIRDERIINAQISILMGKGLHELESITDPEVMDFRKRMRAMCERIAASKDNQDWLQQALCYYPPDLANEDQLPEHLSKRLDNGNLIVSIRLEEQKVIFTFQVKPSVRPKELIHMAFDKRSKTTGEVMKDVNLFVLKIIGLQEYLLGDYPISRFMHIREKIAKSQQPDLIVVKQESVIVYKPMAMPRGQQKVHPALPEIDTPQKEEEKMLQIGHNLYDLNFKYSLTLDGISNVTTTDFILVSIRACLYHGGETLCSVINFKEKLVNSNPSTWNETLNFDIELRNIPRMARLCFLLYCMPDNKKGKRTPTAGGKRFVEGRKEALAWVNIPVFDYKGQLRSGNHKLFMWPVTDDDVLTDELLNPIGTVENNPQTDDAVCLDISFAKYHMDGPIYYPPFSKVLEVAAQNAKFISGMDTAMVKLNHLDLLRAMIERDALHVLHEQEKELIWNLRFECMEHFPHSLPKLLSCVKWDNYVEVSCMQALLQIWHGLSPLDALELLDFQYADKTVRNFAVRCLSGMTDPELNQYLLQLVQVLKYESYLECDLIEFLLKRALGNHKIGHNFFWLLRSEMHVPSVSVRFGLILEAYCRGNTQYLTELSKEVDALTNLRQLSDHIKNCGYKEEKLRDEVKKGLEKKCHQALSLLCCPLNPRIRMRSVRIDKCKSMDSKMKPLWLVWENFDPFGADAFIMYKKGDDLRQDMLTLQMLRIMDSIWQMEGLDFRLNPYGCLSTGQNEGLIEIVTNSRTLANIQMDYTDNAVTASFNKQCIYHWLKTKNQNQTSLNHAMDEFMLSCAGYSVATYVLGVADRHSDNIMIRESGQLFHIDFGHILGHFKSKLGVKRERAPFVLTADFVYVINRGPDKVLSKFKEFENLCERAFLILRQQSKFLITLFMMMMNTGIPEVSCIKDIEYLKETLVPHMSDQEAIAHFRSKMKEALKNSWKTSMNHMFHNMRVKGPKETSSKTANHNNGPVIPNAAK